MPALANGRTVTIPGWTGGVREQLEPGGWDPAQGGVIDDGRNLAPARGDRLAVRGGSRVLLTFQLHSISQVLGVWAYSATGAVAICYSATEQRHYAYALTDALGWAITPAGGSAPTELASCVDLGLGWATATPGRPQAVELFETLYVADARPLDGAPLRRPMVALTLGTSPAAVVANTFNAFDGFPLRPAACAMFNSHLFIAGYDSNTATDAPHMLRHSFLGRNPAASDGFDPDGYAIIGAQGQPVRALSPGNTLLLVAKEAELYRITGSGRGVAGWQFAIAQLDTSLGVGCTNAYALAHAEGMWYGCGRGGPFATDGRSVESLVPSRRRSWAQVDMLESAVVTVHPERGSVLFGLHTPGADPGAPGVPRVWWVWDLVRQQWQPSWTLGRSYHFTHGIASGVTGGPQGALTAPVQQYQNVGDDFRRSTFTFTGTDTTAETEVWVRDIQHPASVTDRLDQALAAGVRTFTVAFPTTDAQTVRVRPRKAGVTGAFTDEVAVQRGWYTRTMGDVGPAPTGGSSGGGGTSSVSMPGGTS